MEKETIRIIRKAVNNGVLKEPFSAKDVHIATKIKINTCRTFLPKHRVNNPGGNTELFEQVGIGRYRLG